MDHFLLCARRSRRVPAPRSVMATGTNHANSSGRIRGGLKASRPNKSYDETEREQSCQKQEINTSHAEASADWTGPVRAASLGQEVCSGGLSSLCLSVCSGANLPSGPAVCKPPQVCLHQSEIMFYSHSPREDLAPGEES